MNNVIVTTQVKAGLDGDSLVLFITFLKPVKSSTIMK